MARSKAQSESTLLSQSTLRLAALKGWAGVTLKAVAKDSKISLQKIHKRYPTKYDLIPVVAQEIDRLVFSEKKISNSLLPHDILFDLLMERFDVLQLNRQAILALSRAAQSDRRLGYLLLRATFQSIDTLLERAQLNRGSFAQKFGLSLIYGWAFWVWRQDQSRDMAKTMAALDRALRLAGRAASFLDRRSPSV